MIHSDVFHHLNTTTQLFMHFHFQFVSRVDIKYKRMNSNERVRILNPGSVTIPRAEGEHGVLKGGREGVHRGQNVLTRETRWVRSLCGLSHKAGSSSFDPMLGGRKNEVKVLKNNLGKSVDVHVTAICRQQKAPRPKAT